ncbi:prepilin peptidase-dependent pilin [Xenorhabdus sp. 42]|uniref:Prepilin peptidase-dependent pilin n=1 Tax=Xenorhabdus szentirmaii TaxID=290112 RepID=A0AAW3YYC0_9GAMM|nr:MULTISPECIES: prepilin peptidase-dependent pilin [unclassified Xenorhabdus]MBD2780032.1 prepilin peptidase-dependent pilin [Xenorhabdus sp. 38]MBD2793764.1 prepilin peptidase-dependent pilin [Xenorhabdus sp. CUL]MBD2801163.1 prepilin peptidase-dependent pilin [Xenorhabdus sp. M]MBD2805479.1 prepilin peptidase-dependent pilin [Xenorhabdus sp. ZM]MBD2822255.1 prepilin peptidase-dependent pilin [Xenorhabdus sp. 42]
MNQKGFTLMEVMVVMAIVSILSAIGIPSYQGYIQKAALTDMLQAIVPYKSGVELCRFETENYKGCHSGQSSIPSTHNSRYVNDITVKDGEITVVGQQNLSELNITLKPTQDTKTGITQWKTLCKSENESLKLKCQETLKF